MSRALNDLHHSFRPMAIELCARIVEARIAILIVDTLRTMEEHQENLRRGTSWTTRSRHLDGLAIDLCPYHSYALHGPDKLQWDAKDPVWQRMGDIGRGLGLKWGVWAKNSRGVLTNIDPGHFEHPSPAQALGRTIDRA